MSRPKLRYSVMKCVYHPMFKRSNRRVGGRYVSTSEGKVCVGITVHLRIDHCRGDKIQISDILWDDDPVELNQPLEDGSGIDYGLVLTGGELTKRFLRWELERSRERLENKCELKGKLHIYRTGGKRKTIRCIAIRKPITDYP